MAETNDINAWTTDQLITEAVRRSVQDLSSLRRVQETMLRALLTALDSQSAPTS